MRSSPEFRKIAVAYLVVAVAATLIVVPAMREPVVWSPDGLFYQEHVLELRGVPEEEAMAQVFRGPISAPLRKAAPQWLANDEWIAFTKPLFERRLTVPLVAAAIYPLSGERSIQIVSLAGFLAVGLLLLTLLLFAFPVPLAVGVTVLALLVPPLKTSSVVPLTDSWGLALMIAGLIAALFVLRRGLAFLPLWIGIALVLGFTRDTAWVLVFAVSLVALCRRERRWAILAATGVAAALPAALLFGLPLQEALAYCVNGFALTDDSSVGFIAKHYPGAVSDLVRSNVGYLRRGELYTAAYMVGGVLLLLWLGSRRPRPLPDIWLLVFASVVAGIAYLLAMPNYSAFRLELVFLPAAAFGIALLVIRLSHLSRSLRLSLAIVDRPAFALRPATRDQDEELRG